ncbi:MAG: cell envelope integrity protein TolA [Eubacterium sp.]|nr:cell envelope integrity protein TolA [Eubacterium sp.]
MRIKNLTALALGLMVIAVPFDSGVEAQPDNLQQETEISAEMEQVSIVWSANSGNSEALVSKLMEEQKADLQTEQTEQTTVEEEDEAVVEKSIQEAQKAADEKEAQLAKAKAERERAEKEAAKKESIRKGQLAKVAAVRAQKAKKAAEKIQDATGSYYCGVRLMYSEPYEGISGHITRSNGVVHYNGNRETWYSIHEPGQTVTAVSIPGKHIAKDGTIRDKDGYICVAASTRYKKLYTTLMTSVGPAKVYDTGCSYGTIDIYTNW